MSKTIAVVDHGERPFRETDSKFILCRAYGHAWAPIVVRYTTNSRNEIIEYRPHLECARCKATRVQVLSYDGGIVGNRYRYPDGYLQPKDRRGSRLDVRNEFLYRTAGSYVPLEAEA